MTDLVTHHPIVHRLDDGMVAKLRALVEEYAPADPDQVEQISAFQNTPHHLRTRIEGG